MSLFKKKEKEPKSCCSSSCNTAGVSATPSCCEEAISEITSVKVLGAGCASCHQMYENAKEAVKSAGLYVEVEYETDLQKVMSYGVMSVPALVLNDNVVSVGKVLKPVEIQRLLKNRYI